MWNVPDILDTKISIEPTKYHCCNVLFVTKDVGIWFAIGQYNIRRKSESGILLCPDYVYSSVADDSGFNSTTENTKVYTKRDKVVRKNWQHAMTLAM